eukprot:CAMPEP_0172578128 /NCGR_PEP_ID=MMETSP1067-20121228/138579_1 /TAXON_ID=265564 ORGANISM="Thalassiosira punctigera, Strain Tpunct2005C2" /NCGR_SAMPLE_ID=MMETSP1067 /ASSEMBLY_ACC=CAM_ASM_000444 /LENGTH=298 /DNA_ID=CAMNT_0013370821 /DNA_START=195 /DNA_END=1091 /DNA_ORIENTATION=+
MPPAKKKQKTVQPITISDIRVAVIKKKLKAGVKEKDRAFSDFTVRYALVLANKCCHGSSRIMVSSNNTLWDEDAEGGEKDQAKEMQKLVAAALDRHKSAAADREKDCALDVEFGSGALPAADSTTWDYLWGYAENEMRKQLTESTGDADQPIWLGRTIANPDWGNDCIWRNASRGTKSIDGALVTSGACAIYVQWYTQRELGVLEYVVEGGANAKPIISSNKDLIDAGFEMTQVYGSSVRVPRRRTVRSNQMSDFEYSGTRSSLQTSEGDWYRREYGNMYRLDVQLRDRAMDRAGLQM